METTSSRRRLPKSERVLRRADASTETSPPPAIAANSHKVNAENESELAESTPQPAPHEAARIQKSNLPLTKMASQRKGRKTGEANDDLDSPKKRTSPSPQGPTVPDPRRVRGKTETLIATATLRSKSPPTKRLSRSPSPPRAVASPPSLSESDDEDRRVPTRPKDEFIASSPKGGRRKALNPASPPDLAAMRCT
jgi:hypothetical protein